MDWRTYVIGRISVKNPCNMSIALSSAALFITLFVSGCIGSAGDVEGCDTADRAAEADLSGEDSDPCSDDDDLLDTAVSTQDFGDTTGSSGTPSALCTTRTCSKDP
jgi:hypothetical protein